MHRFSILVVGCLVAAASCSKPRISANELFGTWAVAADQQQLLHPGSQSDSASVVLDSSGSFAATAIPGTVLYPPSQGRGIVVTGSGTWALGEDVQGRLSVILEFRSIDVGELSGVPYGISLPIGRRNDQPAFYFYNEDPDAGPRIYFVRK